MSSNSCESRLVDFLRTVFLSCAVVALAYSASASSVAVSLKVSPGEIDCAFSAPFQLQARRVGDHVTVIVHTNGPVRGAEGISEVKLIDGGFSVELPLAGDPSVKWISGGIAFRWTPLGKSTPGTLFDTTLKAPTYPLGPGDKLKINVYNVENMNQTVTVDPDGFITFPVLDKVKVKGLTVNQLQAKFQTLLARYVKNPQISIQLVEYGSRYVNVLGEVGSPGRIPLKGALRVLDAVSQAGGFTISSGDVEIQRRDASGKLHKMTVTQEDLLAGNGSQSNIYLRDRDVVNVLSVRSVYVSGEVSRPGSFPYNKDLTLLKAIALAGGFTQWAKKTKVVILREKDGKPGAITVNAAKIERGTIDDVPLRPNDHIVVRERKFF